MLGEGACEHELPTPAVAEVGVMWGTAGRVPEEDPGGHQVMVGTPDHLQTLTI